MARREYTAEELAGMTDLAFIRILEKSHRYSKATIHLLIKTASHREQNFFLTVVKQIVDRTYRNNSDCRWESAVIAIQLLPTVGEKGLRLLESYLVDSNPTIRWRAVSTVGRHRLFVLYPRLRETIMGESDESNSSIWALGRIDLLNASLKELAVSILLDFKAKFESGLLSNDHDLDSRYRRAVEMLSELQGSR